MKRPTEKELAAMRFDTIEDALKTCPFCRADRTVKVLEQGCDQDGYLRVGCECQKCLQCFEINPTQYGIMAYP
jgi:hypothetical protein